MRRELEEMHLQAGKSKFSAGLQSHLSTNNMKNVGLFLDPNISFERSPSLIQSSVKKNGPQQDLAVIRGFELNHIPAEMVLEHLNPELALEKEEDETDVVMPLVS